MGALESAQAEVALKYDPQQAQLQRQLDALKAQTAASESGINKYGEVGRTGIQTTYDTLASLLGANRTTSAGEQQQVGQQLGNIYDSGASYQQQIAQGARSRLAELAGMTGAGPGGELQALQPYEQENAKIQGSLQMAKANALANQGQWANRWDQILGQGQNIGEQTRAQESSRFETELLNMLGANKVAGLEGENELYGKLGDILGARQNDLITSYERLQQQEWERAFQQAQLDQEASIENAKLAMQKYGIDAQSADNAARIAAENNLSWEEMLQLAQEQQKIDAEIEDKRAGRALASEGLGLQRREIGNAERSQQSELERQRYEPGNLSVAKMIESAYGTGSDEGAAFSEKERQAINDYAWRIKPGMPNQYAYSRFGSGFNNSFKSGGTSGGGMSIPIPPASGRAGSSGSGLQIPSWLRGFKPVW